MSDLALPVDTDDATAGIVDCSDKDGLSADAVHVDAGSRLNVVEVDVAKLGDQVDYVILGAHLEGLREGRGDQKMEGERGGGRGEEIKGGRQFETGGNSHSYVVMVATGWIS